MEPQSFKHGNPSNKQRGLITAGLLLLSVALLAGLTWIVLDNLKADPSNETGSILATETDLEAQLLQQKTELADKTSQLEEASTEIDNLNNTVISTTARMNSVMATQSAQQAAYDLLAASLESNKTTYQQDQDQLAQLQSKLMCDNSANFTADFTSNNTLSNSLKTFIGKIGGNSTYASWDVLWPNSKNAIHRITVYQDGRSFTNVFIAYFDEKGFSNKGVFWVNRACWLEK